MCVTLIVECGITESIMLYTNKSIKSVDYYFIAMQSREDEHKEMEDRFVQHSIELHSRIVALVACMTSTCELCRH